MEIINNFIRSVALSGTDPNHPEQFNAIKIANLLTMVFLLLLLVQIPVQLLFWTDYSINQLILIIAHITLFTLVPQLNKLGHFSSARIYLIFIFSSYVSMSSFNYAFMTHVHFFFLVAIIIIPFLHFDLKQKDVILMMLYFLSIFLVWEVILIPANSNQFATFYQSQAHMSLVAQSDKVSFGICCFFVGYFISKSLKSGWNKVRAEQKRSESLLRNILPSQIARRLEKKEKPIADYFDNVTIIFADIEGFSELTQSTTPEKLVSMLNNLFTRFDALSKQHHLEKIKTVGDQYMSVAGLPNINPRHALNACRCAIRMQEEFILWTREFGIKSSLRIGINSGPVIAGVIGIHKFSYDLWGDAVNLASRMESQGQSGRIQLSEATYDLVKGLFMVDYSDTIAVKGMGQQNVYWLKEPYSV